MKNLKLDEASEVILMGISAGGVAAMQWSEYTKNLMNEYGVNNVKLLVDSSVFLDFKNEET